MGLSAAEAMDYWATEYGGYSQSELADRYGVSRQAVHKNVTQARQKLRILDP